MQGIRFGALLAAMLFAFVPFCATPQAEAQTTETGVNGSVVDARTALPIAGVAISAQGPEARSGRTDEAGRFTIRLAPGQYVLTASVTGYQSAQSETLTLAPGQTATVTLSLQRETTGVSGPTIIGRTSTSRTAALQSSSVIYRTVTAQQVFDTGSYRVGDVLKQLPGVFDASSQTATPSDDLKFAVRGIGTLETTTLLDGHPFAQGAPGGFNFELSPLAALRDTQVVYGSGSDLFPVPAIGGVINLRTIEPTGTPQTTISQQIGTWGQSGTFLQSTGTLGQGVLGYAFGLGVQGTDGYQRHAQLYNFSAAYDPSNGPGSPGYQSGIYDVDTSSTQRSAFGKLVFALGGETRLTLQGLTSGFFDNKTGNGDNDYQTPELTLANGSQGSCPAGEFQSLNQAPGGSGGPGVIPCLTQAQYVQYYGGWNGAGPAYQTFSLADGTARLDTRIGGVGFQALGFMDRYTQHYDRYFQLPYTTTLGDNAQTNDTYSSNAGLQLTAFKRIGGNDLALGYYGSILTYTGSNDFAGSPVNVVGKPAKEQSFFLRDAYAFGESPFSAFLNVWERRSTITEQSTLDPRLAVVYAKGRNVVRVAAGATTTQPDLSNFAPFTAAATGSLQGNYNANSPNVVVGNVPAGALKPERGVDYELSIGHRFGARSIANLTLYTTNVFDKIYSATVPAAGLSGIPADQLAALTNFVRNVLNDKTGEIDVSGPVNVGQLRARGIELNGVQELPVRGLRFDYDYATESTALISAPASLLRRGSGKTLIPGSQLPRIPLHRYNLGLGYAFRTFDVRYGYHEEDANNSRNLPRYDFSDLQLSAQLGRGRLAFGVNNLFNQYADVRGLENEGYPLPLNSYAKASDYDPITGRTATERFGLPYRTFALTYSIRTQ